MASFVGRADGHRVRVNVVDGEPQVVRHGEVIATGWPTVAGGALDFGGVTVTVESPARTTVLDWREIDGVRAEGGIFASDKAVATLAGELMLFPASSRVRAGVRLVSGWTEAGEPVEWLVAGKFSGCGCGQ